jgi:DNA mismatch repair ATPase MutS
LSIAGIACIAGAIWWHPLVLGVIAVLVVNGYVRAALRDGIDAVVPGMRMLPALLQASRTLASLHVPEVTQQATTLRDIVPRLQWLGRAARWLSFEQTGANELAAYLYEYLNMLLLLDVVSWVWSVEAIRREREIIRRAYEALGELDVLQSVATLRGEPRPWSRPVFIARRERRLLVAGLAHPLLEEPVTNPLALDGRSMLLTGSNMSGKSTFIRAVGVNAILARTVHMVFAERWHAPLLAARTSIGRADSLLEGTSYYRAEVDAVGALLRDEPGVQRIILIDELFRGTNSVERIAAAKAVLVHLDRGDDLVIVATHDLELIPMLPSYAQYHFREEVREGALTFDYRLHDGPSSTRNALAILALAGYPADVVADAERTAVRVEQRVTSNE